MKFKVVYWLGSCITERIIEARTKQEVRNAMKDFNIINIKKVN